VKNYNKATKRRDPMTTEAEPELAGVSVGVYATGETTGAAPGDEIGASALGSVTET
jgi:hypothetical protein